MEGDTALKQKFIDLVTAMDASTAYAGSHLIFECCQRYQREVGRIDSNMIRTVARKLGINERKAAICSHWPGVFPALQRMRHNGRNRQIRNSLSETDKVGFDCFLTIQQLVRLGGRASLSRLQSVMSGCHRVYASDLSRAIKALQQLGWVTEECMQSRQWWRPHHAYAINEVYLGSLEEENGVLQSSSPSGALAF